MIFTPVFFVSNKSVFFHLFFWKLSFGIRIFVCKKKIKQIRNLLALTSWAKYYEYDDLDVLRKEIIEQLIYTTKSLDEIKRVL